MKFLALIRKHLPKTLVCSSLAVACLGASFSAQAFVVKKIKVQGLQRIRYSTLRNYLPARVGQPMTTSDSDRILGALYKTGFFDTINLVRQGSTLLVQVHERPIIALIRFKGNHKIKDAQLKKALNSMQIVVGDSYDASKLSAIVLGLKQQYQMLGYPHVTVDVHVKPQSRNRVAIDVQVQEGSVVKLARVHFSGNKAFTERQLRSDFTMKQASLWTLLSKSDRYSQMKLDQALDHLNDWYMNHGYLDFKVVSHQVVYAKNNKRVSVWVKIHEGQPYHINQVTLRNDSHHAIHVKKLRALLTLKKGQIFNRSEVLAMESTLSQQLSDHGYAFSQVEAVPTVDKSRHTLDLSFHVVSGPAIYVRYIHFTGNHRTSQLPMRFQLQQLEGSMYSFHKIQETKQQLANLPFVQGVTVKKEPVSGVNNQVDLAVTLHEVNAGKAALSGGYGTADGFFYGASVSDPNFMGSGKYVSVGFKRSQFANSYNFAYNNPYYTSSGVSRGWSVFYANQRPGEVNKTRYETDLYGFALNYGFPITLYDSISFSVGYTHQKIAADPDNAAKTTLDFINKYGNQFDLFPVTLGWSHRNLDRYIFPTKGWYQQVSAEMGLPVMRSRSLAYYSMSYHAALFMPLKKGFIFKPHVASSYGGGYGSIRVNGVSQSLTRLPFFLNYYAGGLGSIPGYRSNTLGPKDGATGDPIGGNLLLLAGADLILPSMISDRVRLALTYDAGNVYAGRIDLGHNPLRQSLGLTLSWFSPLGVIEVGAAGALNKKPGDETQLFQVSFGGSVL